MNRLLAVTAMLGDRVNPVAVREFRQAVQSRLVIALLMLFLALNLTVLGGYLMLWPNADTSATGGQTVFGFLLTVLLITCIGFVPLYTGIRMALERNDTNIDLLFITTLTPGAIVRGKYLASTALTLLIFSVCMPFMTFTYLLRGIDLLTISLVLAGGFLVCAAANAGGILIGCLQGSWFLRGIASVGMFLLLFYLAAITIALASTGIMFGLGVSMSDWRVWLGIGSYLLLEVLTIGLLHVLSVAMLSSTSSNRMLIPRLYIMGTWLITGALMILVAWLETSLWPVMTWVIGNGVAFSLMLVTTLGERDDWTIRVRRTIPRKQLPRFGAFLLYTGSAGGLIWCALMFGATMLCAGYWIQCAIGRPEYHNFVAICWAMAYLFGYVMCYCLTIAFLRLTLLRSIPTRHLSAIAAFFGIVVYLAPCLVAFLLSRDWWYRMPWCMLGSPIVLTTGDEAAIGAAGPFLLGWLILGLLVTLPWWNRQWQRFVPYQTT